MQDRKYPYQDLTLKDIKGEIWEDIPGAAGYYMISNFGRVKRLEHEVQYRNGAIYHKPEMIIKPTITRARNKFIGDQVYWLTSRTVVLGKRNSFSIARLVYHCFKGGFDMNDRKTVILTRNCDNFNIRLSNLVLASFTEKQRRVIERKRFRSPFFDLKEEEKKKIRKKIIKAHSRQVTQYTLSGRKIKTYSSIAKAQKATGTFASYIGKVAGGGGISSGGFVWRFGKAGRVDVNAYKQASKKKRREKYGYKVSQYDFSGKKIAQFASLTEAQEATGINAGAISLVTKGVYKSAKGYFWKKGHGKDRIDLSAYNWGKASMAVSQSKKVRQYTLAGKYVQTFSSVKEAAVYIGVSKGSMSGACIGRQKTCGGYKWRFA